ncbi:hypothetical protein [Fretibacter rubidus]|uniref:hypothetical protein n=1 Tax=Fretibacter rubidus TaxID=570162 RepID=UPI00352ADDCE
MNPQTNVSSCTELVVRLLPQARIALMQGSLIQWVSGVSWEDKDQVVSALIQLEKAGLDVASEFITNPFINSSQNGFFQVQEIVASWIPRSIANIFELARIAENFAVTSGRDMTVGAIYGAWEKLIQNRLNEAENFIQHSIKTPSDKALLLATLNGLVNSSNELAFVTSLPLVDHDNVDVKRAAILAIANIKLSQQQAVLWMSKLLALEVEPNFSEKDLLAHAFLRLCRRKHESLAKKHETKILHVLHLNHPEVRYRLYEELWRHEAYYSDWVIFEVIKTMSEITTDELGCLDRIGMWLGQKKVSLEFHKVRAATLMLASSEFKLSHKELSWFRSQLLADYQSELAELLVLLLLNSDTSVSRQSIDLVDRLDNSILIFSDNPLLDDPNVRSVLLSKAMGHSMFERGLVLSVACAVFNRALDDDELTQLISDFTEFWLRNFPGDYDLMLQAGKDKNLSQSAEKALRKYAKPFVDRLSNLKTQKAFAVEVEQRLVQMSLRLEESRQVRQGANENSIFADIFTTKNILHGSETVFSVFRGDDENPQRQVMPMSSISHSLTVPMMSVLCPTYYQYQRLTLLGRTI